MNSTESLNDLIDIKYISKFYLYKRILGVLYTNRRYDSIDISWVKR